MQAATPEQTPPFNAVVEGAMGGDLSTFRYKLVNVHIPERILGFVTYGTDGFYEGVNVAAGTVYDIHDHALTDRPNLTSMPGVVLPWRGGAPRTKLRRARSLYISDGRLFVEHGMVEDEGYMSELLCAVDDGRLDMFFHDEDFTDIYRKAMKQIDV